MIHRGGGDKLANAVGTFALRVMLLAADCIQEDGTIRPLVAGGVMDQPCRLWAALRIVRSERARLQAEDRRRRENESKRKR